MTVSAELHEGSRRQAAEEEHRCRLIARAHHDEPRQMRGHRLSVRPFQDGIIADEEGAHTVAEQEMRHAGILRLYRLTDEIDVLEQHIEAVLAEISVILHRPHGISVAEMVMTHDEPVPFRHPCSIFIVTFDELRHSVN